MLPRLFRQHLAQGGLLTRGWHGCLWLFPWEQWGRQEERLAALKPARVTHK